MSEILNLKMQIIGGLFDLLLVDKNFSTLNSEFLLNNDKNKIHHEFLFKTTYVGKNNWIKIIIPYNIKLQTNDLLHFNVESIIDSKIFKNENMFIDDMWDYLNNLQIQK